ncbi:MAG: DUF4421 family protein [Maribacter sp.]|uniref:DUF4421 family protein n=1 Tax=Maribacter sp. TaxID=1897614 RepID=UPI0032989319
MKSKTGITTIILLYSLAGFAQQDSAYVRKFPEKVTVRLGVQNTSNSFVFTNTETNEITSLVPNDKTYLGISFLFRSVELDLGYAPNFFSENQDNKGSKLFTLNFRMFMGKWMQTLDFYKQKGFFLGNLEEIDFLSFPEARTLKIGGTTSYIFNDKFSFRAIGFQNEWQKKSAGSFIPSLSMYYTRFNLQNTGLFTGNQAINLALGPGYYYNWVVKKHIILAAGITAGFGVNFTKSSENNNSAFLFQTMLRTAIGYNSEHFFTGLNVSFQFVEYDANPNTILQDDITFAEIYLGYRFKAPKKWIDKAAKVNRKFGLD